MIKDLLNGQKLDRDLEEHEKAVVFGITRHYMAQVGVNLSPDKDPEAATIVFRLAIHAIMCGAGEQGIIDVVKYMSGKDPTENRGAACSMS